MNDSTIPASGDVGQLKIAETEQISLFDDPARTGRQRIAQHPPGRAASMAMPAAALAARADPISSHLAAAEVTASGRRDSQKREILEWLRDRSTPVTSMELAHAAGMDRYIVARRLPDLERDRQVQRGAMRECEISGRLAITWRPA